MSEVSRILWAIEQGDAGAAEHLLPLVYKELRGLAALGCRKSRPARPCKPPRSFTRPMCDWLATARPKAGTGGAISSRPPPPRCGPSWWSARAGSNAGVHGGGRKREELDPNGSPHRKLTTEIIALDIALASLADDPRKARLVELRYFACNRRSGREDYGHLAEHGGP